MGKYYFFSDMKAGANNEFFWTPSRQNKLKSMITVALQRLGNAVFEESQRRVPIVTGNLKSSGSITFPNNGFDITYTATYARDVELGRRSSTGAVPSSTWKQKVPRHLRRTKTKGNIWIAAHEKNYKSGKPTLINGQWRTFTQSSVSSGKHFVGGSLKSLLKGSFSTNNGFQKYLQTDTI